MDFNSAAVALPAILADRSVEGCYKSFSGAGKLLAAMSAAKFKLDNLITIIDRNGLSMDGPTEEIMPLEPLADKWRAFGWAVKTIDGHNIKELLDTFQAIPLEKGKPTCIIAKTVKGKGCPYMENQYKYHYGSLTQEGFDELYKELERLGEVE